MRFDLAMVATVFLCAGALAGPDGQGKASCAAEGTWTIDLAIAAKPPVGCAGLKAVVGAFALLDERDLPNSQAGGKPKPANYYPKTAAKMLAGLKPFETCRTLQTAAGKTSDSSVALHAIELITITDDKAGSCTKGLRAALGGSPEAKSTLEQAADLCEGRKETHCVEVMRQAR